jgi:type IV pilus assembly protein PilW
MRSMPSRQRGLTLVELMVSVALALLVTLAALAAMLTSRQSGSAVEQAANLRDNARLGTELVRRIVLQAGFESLGANTTTREGAARWNGADPDPDVEGYDNAIVPAGGTTASNGNRPSGCGGITDTSCANGSDVLLVRFQGLSLDGKPDGSVINCAGQPVGDTADAAQRPRSMFHVRRSAGGEPTLMCSYVDAAGTLRDTELIEGVEVFQVLYGVDGVTPGAAPSATASAPSVVQRYLRADQLVVPGNLSGTRANWRRVRAIRIGMVLRGPVGSAAARSLVQTVHPLGYLLRSEADAYSSFTTPTDGRLRQEVTFTVLLRNFQGV